MLKNRVFGRRNYPSIPQNNRILSFSLKIQAIFGQKDLG
jgi:hypothetical protein